MVVGCGKIVVAEMRTEISSYRRVLLKCLQYYKRRNDKFWKFSQSQEIKVENAQLWREDLEFAVTSD